jgi:hypothetical protein
MTDLLKKLEPRYEEAGTYIANELDEFNELLFLVEGECVVGFTINRKEMFVLKISTQIGEVVEGIQLGAYELTENKRAVFIYKTTKFSKGFSVRKHQFFQILVENRDIAQLFKEKAFLDYTQKILEPVMREKNTILERWSKRSDLNGMFMLQTNEMTNHPKSTYNFATGRPSVFSAKRNCEGRDQVQDVNSEFNFNSNGQSYTPFESTALVSVS